MGDTDIESFIAQQKAKLAVERQTLSDEPSSSYGVGGDQNRNNNYGNDGRERQKWATYDTGNAPAPAEQRLQARDGRVGTPVDRGLPLTNRNQEERQRALALERKREYNDLMEKKSSQNAKHGASTTSNPLVRPGLNIGNYEDKRKVLDRERQVEYNNFLEHKRGFASSKLSQHEQQPGSYPADKREPIDTDAGKLNYQEQKKHLAEERRREYNQLLQQKSQPRARQPEQEIDNPSIIPFNRVEQERLKARILEEERQREYNQTLAKMQERPRKREVTPVPNFDLQGQEHEKRLQKEREQREYKSMLDKQQDQQKQMMLLQQGVPYERVSKMREDPKPNADYVSHLPPRPDVHDRADREPAGYRAPIDNNARDYDILQQPVRRDYQVQFDLDANAKYSPAPTAYSRQQQRGDYRPYQDNPPPPQNNARGGDLATHIYPDRDDHEPFNNARQQPAPRFQEKQQQPPDQFAVLGFGQYEEEKKRLRSERRRELQEHLSTTRCHQDKMNITEYQRQWQQFHGKQPTAIMPPYNKDTTDLQPPNGTETGLQLSSIEPQPRHRNHELEKAMERDKYRKEWYDFRRGLGLPVQHGDGGQTGQPRKTWGPPSDVNMNAKLSPRGTLDTEAIIRNVQKETEREEYVAEWRKFHQNTQQATSRAPPANMTGGQKLDTDRIIRNVTKENRNDPDTRRQRSDANSGLNFLGQQQQQQHQEAHNPILGRDGYRQEWKERQQQQQRLNLGMVDSDPPRRSEVLPTAADESRANINQTMAQARMDADQYRQKWADFNGGQSPSHSGSRLSHQPSPNPSSADYRQRLSQARNREYNQFLLKKNEVDSARNRRWDTPETAAEERVLPLGGDSWRRRHHDDQRRRDWLEHLAKSRPNHVQYYENEREDRDNMLSQRSSGPQARHEDDAFPLGGYALVRKRLNEERRRDYNELLAKQQFSPRGYNETTPRGGAMLIRDDGRREGRLKQMESDRNREYNQLMANKRANNSSLKDQTDDFKAGSLPGNESDSVKWQQRKQRNDEYNSFLANKNTHARFDDKKRGLRENVNSLPSLNYSGSAQKRQKEEERNREYNEMIQQKGQRPRGGPPADVRTGWGTPDYGDILAKQRAREQNFRRANDIAYEADPVVRQTDAISRALDRDYEATSRPFSDSSQLVDEHKQVSNPNGPPSVRRSKDQGGEYFASLPLGRNTDSAQQRQKNRYGNELKMQMAEAHQARQIERKEGLLVNSNSVAAPVMTRPPVGKGPRADPYYNYLKNLPDYDELSPRSNAILGRRQPTSERLKNKGGLNPALTPRDRAGDGGILDLGMFNQQRTTSLDPPAGLVYQPSTFITANAVPQLNSSVDEAYSFYASQNPLDPSLKTDVPPPGGGGHRDVPSLNLGGGGFDPGPGSRVRFQEPRTAAQGMQFSTDDDRKRDKKQNVNDYRAELERQMAENNMKKQRAREDRERYELKMEEEAKYYDPFGKGGGGAPMRDVQGNVISDLRQMRNDNVQQVSHRGQPPPRIELPPSFTLDKSPRGGAPSSYRDDLIGPAPTQTTADGDPSHARGGHGIFGMPKTDVEKLQADKYKLDLKRQMEEKKAEEYRKKQLEKIEEEREQKILDEQRAKIQREYEEEQRRNNEKKEEARRKNEEMMKAAEEKKRELERQRKEEEESRQEEIRQQRERELQERQREDEARRGKSPPIPALRGQGGGGGNPPPAAQEDEADGKEDVESRPEPSVRSPPVPGARAARTPVADSRQDHGPYNRAQSADVLNQLTKLRTELRKESDRVQTMLHDQEDDVQIFDPRHIQRPPPGPIISTKPEVDVFDTALNRNPVVVRRTPNERANSRAVDDFNALKHKMDTDSRKQFRDLYPGEPTSSDALEAQQAALLRQQEERLQYLKDRKPPSRALEDTSALRVAGPGRDTHSSSSQLVSNSAFVEVNGIGHFPDDFEDIPRRNDSARYRRRSRVPSSPQIERIPSPDFNSRATFGSQTSLNVDKMARKNEDRLRKLRDLQGDDLSLYDPEDVLDRFMSKQGHNRLAVEDMESPRPGDTSAFGVRERQPESRHRRGRRDV